MFDPETGADRNVILEVLELEDLARNRRFQLTGESPDVFSTGTYRSEDGITDGFGRGNTLHANGFFQLGGESTTPEPPTPEPPSDPPSSAGSLIRFAAAGTTGEEIAQVIVNDEVVFETQVAPTLNSFGGVQTRSEYQVILDQNVDLNDIRIAFVNDGLTESGEDRDLLVEYVLVRNNSTGEVQRTTAADDSTFSTGTFVDGTLESGFGRGFTLHTNGFFEFANSSRFFVFAGGSTGEEQFQVLVGDEVVGEFVAGSDEGRAPIEFSRTQTAFLVDVPEAVAIEDIRIQFTNDGSSADGTDRNLDVFGVQLDGRDYDSDSAFSTGTFLASDGVVPGTGRGSTLHTNGFVQFGVESDAGSVRLPNFRSTAEVAVRWLPPATTGVSPFIGLATFNEEDGGGSLRLERTSGLDGPAFITFQVAPSTFDAGLGPVPSTVSQDPITVVFEDGQLAANLFIPIEDNNVADSGSFEIRVIDQSDDIEIFFGTIFAETVDQDA